MLERAILLDKGKLVFEGKSNTVVDKYLVGMKTRGQTLNAYAFLNYQKIQKRYEIHYKF